MGFYDGKRILNQKDLDGEQPEIYLIIGNRSQGKTTYFNKHAVDGFLRKQYRKIMLLYRYQYEVENVSEKFFKDIKELFFKDFTMYDEKRMEGVYYELFLGKSNEIEETKVKGKKIMTGGVSFGYACCLNKADSIKKLSHLLSDTDLIIFDEFMSETGTYLKNEVNKFISLHVSVARGQGKQSRFVPVIMMSNSVSILNPYFENLEISGRLQPDTKILRGHGFVLEQTFNKSASSALKESRFNKAFSKSDYMKYSTGEIYLNDNARLISDIPVKYKFNYIATLLDNDKLYALKYYPDLSMYYIDKKADKNFWRTCVIDSEYMDKELLYIDAWGGLMQRIKKYFGKGLATVADLECKKVLFKMLKIPMD